MTFNIGFTPKKSRRLGRLLGNRKNEESNQVKKLIQMFDNPQPRVHPSTPVTPGPRQSLRTAFSPHRKQSNTPRRRVSRRWENRVMDESVAQSDSAKKKSYNFDRFDHLRRGRHHRLRTAESHTEHKTPSSSRQISEIRTDRHKYSSPHHRSGYRIAAIPPRLVLDSPRNESDSWTVEL